MFTVTKLIQRFKKATKRILFTLVYSIQQYIHRLQNSHYQCEVLIFECFVTYGLEVLIETINVNQLPHPHKLVKDK